MTTLDQQFLEACQNGDIHTVQTLLQQGANPYFKDSCGRNALHHAVIHHHHNIVKFLITQLKFYPNIKDHEGRTPVMIATLNGDLDMLRTLAQLGANLHQKDQYERNTLHHAVEKGDHRTTEYLITQLQLDPNTQDQRGITPLMIAAQNGDIDMIRLLTHLGANLHITDYQKQTALHHAVKKRRYDAAQYLITQLQLNPNAQDEIKQTPLLIATLNRDTPMIKLLTQLGANPSIPDHSGRPPLHHAIENGDHRTTEYLITQLQLDPNTQDQRGITPLMIAAQNGDVDMLKTLIQLGANPSIIDSYGRNALHHAIDFSQYKITQYLITQLQLNPNAQDQRGIAPLMIAAENGNIKMLRILIQLGANPSITDSSGQNALHHAAKNYKPETASFLINHLYLDPNSQDHQGNTPLHIALQKGHAHTSQTLIQLGANPHIPNHQGQTPTSIARRRQILLEKPQPSPITL